MPGLYVVSICDRVVTAMNLQRAFKQLPEAVALGFDNSTSSSSSNNAANSGNAGSSGSSASSTTSSSSTASSAAQIDSQLQLYNFHRFLMQQLQKELEAEAKFFNNLNFNNVVDEVFGYAVASTTTFLISGTKEVSNPHRCEQFTSNLCAS
jgi:hypothetical protein